MNALKLYAFADEASSTLDGQIRAMRRNHLDGLEIRNVEGVNVSDLSIEKAAEIKRRLDDNGLCVFSIGSPIGKIKIEDPFEPHMDKFQHTLELANCLGAKNLRMFSFFMEGDHGRHTELVMERLRRFAEAAEGSGVTLCHENEKGIFGDVAERCLLIHQNFPAIKAVFDPANFVQCGQDTMRAYEMLKPYIRYMHIKDALINGQVVPAGFGNGNLCYIIEDLYNNGICDFTLEPHLAVFDGLADLEQEGHTSGIDAFAYPDNDTAFDAAVQAFDSITRRQ